MEAFWNGVIQSFTNLTPTLWVSQICGILAFIFLMIAYQLKKYPFLIVSIIANLFFGLESFFAGAIVSGLMSVVAVIRFILMAVYARKDNEKMPNMFVYWIICFMLLLSFGYMIITKDFTNWINYYPMICAITYTILLNNKSYLIIKLANAINEFMFMVFWMLQLLPFSILREFILTVSAFVSFDIYVFQYVKKLKQQNNK